MGDYDPLGQKYRGRINVTVSGLPCQRWELETPNDHDVHKERYVHYRT